LVAMGGASGRLTAWGLAQTLNTTKMLHGQGFFVPSLLSLAFRMPPCGVRHIFGTQGMVTVYLSIELEVLY
jgi:hypothetical protein